MLATCLEAEGFDGVDGSGAVGRVKSGKNGDEAEEKDGADGDFPTGEHAGEKGRHGGEIDEGAETIRDDEADTTADDNDENGFEEKLAKDGFARGAESHADADLASAFSDTNEHYVHDAEAAEKKGSDSDATHENFHAHDDHAIGLCVLDGVPEAGGFLVTRIEIVKTSQSTANLADAILVRFETPGRDEKAVDGVFDGGWFVREIAAHGIEWNKDFAGVEAVVAGVLILGLHRSDDRVGDAIHPDALADRLPFGEELFFCVAAKKGDVASFFVILIVVKTAFECGDTANLLKWRQGADDGNRAAIEEAADLSVVTEFGHDIFASGRFLGDLNVVVFEPANETA